MEYSFDFLSRDITPFAPQRISSPVPSSSEVRRLAKSSYSINCTLSSFRSSWTWNFHQLSFIKRNLVPRRLHQKLRGKWQFGKFITLIEKVSQINADYNYTTLITTKNTCPKAVSITFFIKQTLNFQKHDVSSNRKFNFYFILACFIRRTYSVYDGKKGIKNLWKIVFAVTVLVDDVLYHEGYRRVT